MKIKLIGFAVVSALSCGAASAVTLTTTLIANTSTNVGLITTLVSGVNTAATGTAYIYSTSTELSAANVATNISSFILANPGVSYSRTSFEALLANDPGVVRSAVAFTSGLVTSSASTNIGAVANKTYVWMSTSNGSYGIFQGPNVPSVGAVTLNSATMTEDLAGTSTYTASGTSGFQLVTIPETSTALLGAIGALGLLRRRRN